MRFADTAAMKAKGWDLVHGDGDLEERVRGAYMVIEAQFERSLRAAWVAGYADRHPTLLEYWLMIHTDTWFAPYSDVAARLRADLGPPAPGVMPPNATYWRPRGRMRDKQFRELGHARR